MNDEDRNSIVNICALSNKGETQKCFDLFLQTLETNTFNQVATCQEQSLWVEEPHQI